MLYSLCPWVIRRLFPHPPTNTLEHIVEYLAFRCLLTLKKNTNLDGAVLFKDLPPSVNTKAYSLIEEGSQIYK